MAGARDKEVNMEIKNFEESDMMNQGDWATTRVLQFFKLPQPRSVVVMII